MVSGTIDMSSNLVGSTKADNWEVIGFFMPLNSLKFGRLINGENDHGMELRVMNKASEHEKAAPNNGGGFYTYEI